MVPKWVSYSLLFFILFCSTLAFLYNRIESSYHAISPIMHVTNLREHFKSNDRYQKIVDVVQTNPESNIYFLSTSTDPKKSATSWQKIQTFYLLYPKNVTELTHATNSQQINELVSKPSNSIVISPFEQKEFAEKAVMLNPHKEYYIYIFTSK